MQYVKYPRTYHLPWSEGKSADDKTMKSIDSFSDKRVVVTEKMDGENTTVYGNSYIHARSIDGNSHPSQKWVKKYISERAFNIPEGWRVCGENLYAVHSIRYENLKTYFQVFSIWDERNECLSWDETVEWCALLDFQTVPLIFEGMFNEDEIRKIAIDNETMEGYVIRIADRFKYSEFSTCVGKFVRKNHVQTNQTHWRNNWDETMINTMKV